MIRNRFLLKSLAIFFLLEMSLNIVAPSLSFALTGGPTSPEFSSFEPVDTTDMVNLATGDFVYNTPVLEVPGPEGGYPLSLSYHAGIKLDQEASWVGLGFTLNPGAINRNLNGYPDDNYHTETKVSDYWGGGKTYTQTYSFGATKVFGDGDGIGISASYSVEKTNDTYKGFSVNTTGNLSYSLYRSPIADRSMIGTVDVGISIGSKANSSFLTAFSENLSAHNGLAGKISSYSHTRREGEMQLSFPGNTSVSFSKSSHFTRYWSDEAQELTTFGSLYPGEADKYLDADYYHSWDSLTSYAFDINDLYDDETTTRGGRASIANDINDPQTQLGGSFPAYDQYSVLGQGIDGVMEPVIFENGDLFGQSTYERNAFGYPAVNHPTLSYKTLRKFSDKKVDFRFLHEFSNSLQVASSGFHTDANNVLSVDEISIQTIEGFNNENGRQTLAGSKHIEWFTNEEIVSGDAKLAGFVDCFNQIGDRKLDFTVYNNNMQPEEAIGYTGDDNGTEGGKFIGNNYEDQTAPTTARARLQSIRGKTVSLRKRIGGFKITNASGVTYHYALPIYNYNEYSRTTVKNPRKGAPTFKEFYNNDPYAYSWLLTGITGPDYVDKNNNGLLDDTDWGYWVKFDYGRWADAYQWRTPMVGSLTDPETGNTTFTYGIKELYYLDAIETRSHKAIFIKSKRKDGKGVTSRLEGGCHPREYKMNYTYQDKKGDLTYNVSPVSTMKLDAIYLFEKEALQSIAFDKSRGEKYMEAPTDAPHTWPYIGDPIEDYAGNHVMLEQGKDFVYVKYHNGDLVYDDDDIHDLPQFKQNALRVIEFVSDYSLCDKTLNSIGYFSDLNGLDKHNVCSTTFDRVTEALDARIGLDFEWPQKFNNGSWCASSRIPFCNIDNKSIYSKQSIFNAYQNIVGMDSRTCYIVSDNFRGNEVQYLLKGKLTLKEINFLGRGGIKLMPPTKFDYQENPNYRLSNYDEWGYYHNDRGNSEEDSRRITDNSALHVQAWSLKSVTSPLGAKISVEYEPNQYRKSVYNDFSTFGIEDIKTGDDDNVEIIFNEKLADLSDWFKTGQSIDMKALYVYNLSQTSDKDFWGYVTGFISGTSPVAITQKFQGIVKTLFSRDNKSDYDYYFHSVSEGFQSDNTEPIVAVNQNSIVVHSPRLKELATRKTMVLQVRTPSEGGALYASYNCAVYFVAGFIKVNDPETKYAGGVRVHSLSMIDVNGRNNKTVYEYVSPVDGKSSGVTSYKPFNMPLCQYRPGVNFFDAVFTQKVIKADRDKLLLYQMAFQNQINQPYTKILSFGREVPIPGSIYEYVTIRNFFDNTEAEQHTTYHFKVFDESMVQRINQGGTFSSAIESRTLLLKNSVADVGQLLDVKTYNNQNSIIKSINYNYLFDDVTEPFEQLALASKQGVIQQSFQKYVSLKEYDPTFTNYSWLEQNFNNKDAVQQDFNPIFSREKALITTREDRSNAVTGVDEVDYITGVSTQTRNYSFDFFTGQPLKIVTSDSYGSNYMAVNEPAYRHYPGMGLKIFAPGNAHMLTQSAATYSYKVDDNFVPAELVSASVQTWTDQLPILGLEGVEQNVWRQGGTYQWVGTENDILNPDGTYNISDLTNHPFTNWADAESGQQAEWQKIHSPTLYNGYSRLLEEKDINNNFSSVKMDPAQQKVLVSGANARYGEMVFAGVESYEGSTQSVGSAGRGSGNASSAHAHTGQYSLLVAPADEGFNYTLTAAQADITKKYRATVWVYVPGEAETQSQLNQLTLYYSVNSGEITAVHPTLQKSKSKSWYQMNIDITPDGSGDILIGVKNNTTRGVYFDDFRVQPLTSSVTSYVYDPATDELIYVLDGNNFYTRFEYDALGRLVRSSKELLNFDFGDGKESFRADEILTEMKYNYHAK